MFSDRHYPPSFLAGNRSLRDMLKDPEEYDRRLESINKRREEFQKEKESREQHLKRLADERNKYLYMPPPFMSPKSRESSVSKEPTSRAEPSRQVSFTTPEASSSSYHTLRNSRLSRFTPEPVERSFVMFVHGTESRKPSLVTNDRVSSRPSLTSTDSPFQRRPAMPSPTASSYFYSSPTRPYQESYLVRRTSSTGNVNNRTEIIPVRPSPPPQSVASPSSSSRQQAHDNNQFYTDKHFSSKFLDDSIPLSQMIVSKK